MTTKDAKLDYLKQKLEEEQKQSEYYKSLLSRISNANDTINNKLDELKEDITDQICEVKESVDFNNEKNNTFVSTTNNYLINNLNQENSNSVINIQFSKPAKEKLDHLTHGMMLNILNRKNYNESVGKLMQSIYFHPKAPENWNWCVTDPHAALGTLEYNHETGTLTRNTTEKVIQKNYTNVMFRVVDILEELRQSESFNKPQAINYSRMVNSLGQELDAEQVLVVKQVAYAGRNLSKSLWDYLDIMVETTNVPTRISLQNKKMV